MSTTRALRIASFVLLLVATSGCDKLKGLAGGGKEKATAEPRPSPPGGAEGAVANNPTPTPVPAASEYKVGDRITVEWKGSGYPAKILSVNGKFYFIHYDGYGSEWDETITKARILGRR